MRVAHLIWFWWSAANP